MKIFKVGEVDWIAANTKQEAIQCLADLCFGGNLECEDMECIIEDGVDELSDEALLKLKHMGDDGCQSAPYPRTFKAELDDLIVKKTKFPVHFATTEW